MALLNETGLARSAEHIKTMFSNTAPVKHADRHRNSETLTWDGDATNRTAVLMGEDEDSRYTLVHVSDYVPSVANPSVIYTTVDEDLGPSTFNKIVSDDYGDWVLGDGVVCYNYIAIATKDNATWYDDNTEITYTFPQKGIYLLLAYDKTGEGYGGHVGSITIPGEVLTNVIDPITPEMIGAVRAGEIEYQIDNHTHWAGDIISGTLSVKRGGTGNSSVDTTPTSGSTKMVTSGGVYTALSNHTQSASTITSGILPVERGGTGSSYIDSTPTSGSTRVITSGGVYAALIAKANESHNQAASTITSGTFAGAVTAARSSQTYSSYLLRNSRLSTSAVNPSYDGEICWTYE